MDPTPQTPDFSDPPLPEALLNDLRRSEPAPPFVPAELDRAIVERGFFAAIVRRRWRRGVSWGAWAAAAAAVVALAANVWGPRGAAPGPVAQQTVVGDFDGSGRVDILDAFGLARAISAGRPVATLWDLNHDGRVDQADVDALAAQAVKVSGEGSAPTKGMQ